MNLTLRVGSYHNAKSEIMIQIHLAKIFAGVTQHWVRGGGGWVGGWVGVEGPPDTALKHSILNNNNNSQRMQYNNNKQGEQQQSRNREIPSSGDDGEDKKDNDKMFL